MIGWTIQLPIFGFIKEIVAAKITYRCGLEQVIYFLTNLIVISMQVMKKAILFEKSRYAR